MVLSEHLRKADESYEVRFNNQGDAIHVYIKDSEAIVFALLGDLIRHVYLGEPNVERMYFTEEQLSEVYSSDEYCFHSIARKYANHLVKV